MQESARLPSLISPSWNPQSCTSVGIERESVKKTVSVSGLMNGQHGRPHTNGHQHIQQSREKQAQQQLAKAASTVIPPRVAAGPTVPSGAMGVPAQQSQTQQQQHQRYSSGASPKTHRERWGGWLSGSSSTSLGRSGDSLPRPRGDLPYHTQGYDMTKLYPELSAKLGLTKSPPDNSNQVKNGINIKETTTSGMLRKLEQVDERIKIVSTDHILNNFKLINKVGSDVQNPNPNNMKFSKLKAKSVGSKIETCDIKDDVSHTQQNIQNEKLLNKRVNDNISSEISSVRKTFGISSKSSGSSVLKDQMQMGGISSQDLRVPHFVASGSAHTTVPVLSRLSHGTPSTVTGGRSLVSGQVTYPPSTASQQPRMVQVPPRRRRRRPPTLSTTQQNLPETIVRVQNLQQQHYAYVTDLFPLGIEMSESSDGSDLEDNSCGHLGWLDSKDHCYVIDSSSRNTNSSEHHKRQLLLNTALASHRRQVSLWNERLERSSWSDRRRSMRTGSLVNAARSHPNLAADTCHNNYAHTSGESPKLKTRRPSSVLLHRSCVYEGGSGSGVCSEPSLPGTRHCIRHITYNVDQQLFTHCSARQPDNTRCTMPAADVMQHQPLCMVHTRKKENFIKVKSEESQKPKRTRKKNKMPILSRYGKRNKKRRRPSNSTSSVIPSTCVRPPMSSQTSISSPQPSPTQSQTSRQFSTASCTGDGEGSEFEDDMKDMVGELPLDAAEASRMLDPRDLQDVLNRIPDHELTQLFNDGKGSDYEGSDSEKSDVEKNGGSSGGSGGSRNVVSNNIDGGSSGPGATNTVTTTSEAASGSSKVSASNIKSSVLGKDGTTLSLDESTFNELVAGNIPIDSIISSSFNQQELNTISQALSNIVEDSNINLTGYELAAEQGTPFSQSQSAESNQTSGLSKANDTSQHPCQAT